MFDGRGWSRRTVGAVHGVLFAAATGAGLGGAAACSLIATFDDRPADAGVSSGDAGADARDDEPVVEASAAPAAFPLDGCEGGPKGGPLDPQPCNYRDESCSGFVDLGTAYEEKPGEPNVDAAMSCAPGSLVAWAWSDGDDAEVRVLARVRSGPSAPCPDETADAGVPDPETFVVFRLDAATLKRRGEVPVVIDEAVDGGAGTLQPSTAALGRSERRIVAALKEAPDAKELFVLSTPIDGSIAGAAAISGSFPLTLAARMPAADTFAPVRVTAADDLAPGRFYVSIETADDKQPLITRADELAPVDTPFGPVLKFNDGTTIAAAGAALFDRVHVSQTDAGLEAERLRPGAVVPRADVGKTIMANDVSPQWLTSLRYLYVPGVGTVGSVGPWYAAAALVPEHPGIGFGTQAAQTRLEVWSAAGTSYAQLRSCEFGEPTPCSLAAKPDGGTATLVPSEIPLCNDAVPLYGAVDGGMLPDVSGTPPSLWATCRLGSTSAGSGVVTWHRIAGGFGAVISSDGTKLWIVRPEGVAVAGTDATMRLATTVQLPAGGELVGRGPLSVTFVDNLGWVVVAVERATGSLWARRFGCPGSP